MEPRLRRRDACRRSTSHPGDRRDHICTRLGSGDRQQEATSLFTANCYERVMNWVRGALRPAPEPTPRRDRRRIHGPWRSGRRSAGGAAHTPSYRRTVHDDSRDTTHRSNAAPDPDALRHAGRARSPLSACTARLFASGPGSPERGGLPGEPNWANPAPRGRPALTQTLHRQSTPGPSRTDVYYYSLLVRCRV